MIGPSFYWNWCCTSKGDCRCGCNHSMGAKNYLISSSNPKVSLPMSSGTLYHASSLGGTMHEHQYPTLPEDLSYNPFWDDIWTCTEKPASLFGQTRYCFRVDRDNVQSNGCD